MLNEIVVGGTVIEVETREQIIEVPASEVPESEISVEISSEPLYCLCQEPWDIHNRRFMIHCDHCSDWYHGQCVGVSEVEAKDIEKYHCPKCAPAVGPSVFLDVRSTNTGKKVKSVRCTPEFIAKLKEYKFNIPDEVVLKMRGQALTLPWLIMKGFARPILIESTEALGIKVPPDTFSVKDVERYVGSERMVDVIDVERQTDILMSMREFTDYYTSPSRAKLLNLISLEFTHTNLNKLVEAPYISRKLDWVANYWPVSQGVVDEDIHQRPTVSKYCLISAKDSYTDFHIDFGGTSVWYHVLWGEKVFYLIEPSETNLNLYHRWMDGEMGDECFLADEVPVCFRCVLKKGQTLLIPTGWIHAVYTPEDSLVFGGNFLHFLNMDLQLQIYEMEKQMQTPTKYLFPSFEATHWYAAEGLIQDLQTLNATSFVPAYLIKGLKSLVNVLKLWLGEKDIGKLRREYIPSRLNCKRIIAELGKELRLSEKRLLGSTSSLCTLKEAVETTPQVSSSTGENGFGSREGSPSGPSPVGGHHRSSGISPSSSAPAPIKLRFTAVKRPMAALFARNKPSSTTVEEKQADVEPVSSTGLKMRVSVSDGRAESVDCGDSNTGSDALYIVESETERRPGGSESESEESRRIRRKHHKKCKKNKAAKMKHHREHNKAINEVLAGTLEGIEELFEDSKYSERISQCKTTSQAVKDTVAGMDAMKHSILPLKKRNKHKKKKRDTDDNGKNDSDSSIDGIKQVHQDEDYIYLPLAGSDDEIPSGKHKRSKKGSKKDDDESWSPRVKVGHVGKRELKSNRVNAKRESVDKGLQKAAAMLENPAKLKRKHSSKEDSSPVKVVKDELRKVKQPKLVPSNSTGTVGSLAVASTSYAASSTVVPQIASQLPACLKKTTNNGPPKKPKKGMATPKQRLGKILKIGKFARF